MPTSKSSFVLVAVTLLLTALDATAAARADDQLAPNNARSSQGTASNAVRPYAAVGSYGLAAYLPTVPVSAIPAYGVPVYLAPGDCCLPYYYIPMIYSPVYVDAYTFHFGPGVPGAYGPGHYRFPYYSYRRPWYFPGPPVFNRNTGLVW
ncbi:MAG: hypothetical protein GXP27_21575 [Planctomycetes bacterium]|nr:hypothetical protein [Planctomycetota bacterium]